MRNLTFAATIIPLLIGCNAEQLRFSTLRLSHTVPDLQQAQILDNIARYIDNPGLMPYFSLVYAGTMNVADRGSLSGEWKAVPHMFTEGTYNATGERTVTGNWSLKPTNDSDRLIAFRTAIQIATRPDAPIAKFDLDTLNGFLILRHPELMGQDPTVVIPRGWLCSGTRRDRPKQARYWSRQGKTYVWVMPGREEDFLRFVFIVLDVFTLKGGEPPRSYTDQPGVRLRPSRIDDVLPFNPGMFFIR